MNLIHFFTLGVMYGIGLCACMILTIRDYPAYSYIVAVVGLIFFIILDLYYMSLVGKNRK